MLSAQTPPCQARPHAVIRQVAAGRCRRLACKVMAPPYSEADVEPTATVNSSCRIVSAQVQHFQQVAKLRAEAYYENERSRFVETFKKQFVCQEVESLQRRTALNRTTNMPQCECLVAVPADESEEVWGCIDIRLPCPHTNTPAPGVPTEDPQGAYILNVVVSEGHRGQGIGTALMQAAMSRAIHVWRANALYTHVEADNEVAYQLYVRCGFEEHSVDSKIANTTALGKLVLLKAPASAAAQLAEEHSAL